MARLIEIGLMEAAETIKLLNNAGLSREIFDQIRKPGAAARAVEALTRAFDAQQPESYTITVDYSVSLADMIAAGKYDWVNSDIMSERFPVTGEGKVEGEIVLVHLDRYATTAEVLAELDRRGLRPATIEELLALGAAHPDLQRQFPIAALGSSWRLPGGALHVPFLGRHGDERQLRLRWGDPERGWVGDWRFAAVRKS